tara:strand:- start:620 stop:1918 length:1299 start_codon:yes stop_codon:yes gene_type:complete
MRKTAYDYGMMTLEEFLEHRNPGGKTHGSDSYSFSVDSMNQDYSIIGYRMVDERKSEYTVYGKSDKSAFFFCKDYKIKAVIANKTIYYTYTREKEHILGRPLTRGEHYGYIYPRDMDLREKKVKYPGDYIGLVSNIVEMNTKRYPHLLERFENNGECFSVRSEAPLEGKNQGVSIGIFNEAGYKVATAQDEWGATLIGVAREYRSRGLSKVVSRYWLQYNPDKKSGGMTPAGHSAAVSFWADTVRKMHSEGAYEDRILSGEITQERVDEILEALPPKEVRKVERERTIEPTGELLMLEGDFSFVVYDKSFLVKQDDRFIYGYGLLRDSSDVGEFFYQLDYDREYDDTVTRIALQFAKNQGSNPLYDGQGDHYSDILEVEGISEIRREGEYIYIEGDLVDYSPLVRRDEVYRGRIDKYDEIKLTLEERAVAKW